MQKGARGRQFGLQLRDFLLDGVVARHRGRRGAALLAAGEFGQGFQQPPGDPERDAGEAGCVKKMGRNAVQRLRQHPFLRRVAVGGVLIRNEQVLDGVGIAAGAAQAQNVPVVDHLSLRFQEHEAAVVRPSVADMRRAVGVLHRAVGADPGCVAAAAGETPGAGQTVAALDADGFAGVVLAATFAVLGLLPLVPLAELGFAVAFGVLLDTIIVRSILVPALVHEIGPKIWWPSKLQHEDIKS